MSPSNATLCDIDIEYCAWIKIHKLNIARRLRLQPRFRPRTQRPNLRRLLRIRMTPLAALQLFLFVQFFRV
jgi:hypothetical protein